MHDVHVRTDSKRRMVNVDMTDVYTDGSCIGQTVGCRKNPQMIQNDTVRTWHTIFIVIFYNQQCLPRKLAETCMRCIRDSCVIELK